MTFLKKITGVIRFVNKKFAIGSSLFFAGLIWFIFSFCEIDFKFNTHYPFIILSFLFLLDICLTNIWTSKDLFKTLNLGPVKNLIYLSLALSVINFFVARMSFMTILDAFLPMAAKILFPFQITIIMWIPMFFGLLMYDSNKYWTCSSLSIKN